MCKKKNFLIIICVFCLILLQPVSSSYYYEADDYLNQYGVEVPYQHEEEDSNQVLIEFQEDGNVYIDVSAFDDSYSLSDQLYECIAAQTFDPNANITTLKSELAEICRDNGIAEPNITVTSPYGDDTFIYHSACVGISMYPTIKNCETVVINKTHDVHVGDLVSAVYPSQHGGIVKRVAEIKGDKLFLVSDNVNGSYVKNGEVYEYEGLRTWASMSDIHGVVIDILDKEVFSV